MNNWLSSTVTYLKNGDDKFILSIASGIVVAVVVFIMKDVFLSSLAKLIRLLVKKLIYFIVHLFKKTKSKAKHLIVSISKRREYRKTIKKIESGEIPIPPYFLANKTPEKNPELKRIFEKIQKGEIEEPIEMKIASFMKEHPIDLSKLINSNRIDFGFKEEIPDYIRNLYKKD